MVVKRSNSYAQGAHNKLAQRHKQTNEVKQVLTGEGFKSIKPGYTSKPDTMKAEVQHQVLSHDVNEEIYTRLYGKKANLRHLDPAMNTILGWGEFDPPIKNDFVSNKGAYQEKYKINKMGVEFISEKQDNFRDPCKKVNQPKDEQITDYLQNENQSHIKKKIYKNLVDKDHMQFFSTTYRDEMTKNDEKNNATSKDLHNFYQNVTVAGKARYLGRPNTSNEIVMP